MQHKTGIWKVFAVLAVLASLGGGIELAGATGTTLTITANAVVPTFCGFTATGTTNLNFGSIQAGNNANTNLGLTFTNTGNQNTNVLVQGASVTGYAGWNGVTTQSQGFAIANTKWSLTSLGSYGGTVLTSSPVDTGLVIITGSATTNSMYWGLAIPSYTTAQTYNTVITVTSSC